MSKYFNGPNKYPLAFDEVDVDVSESDLRDQAAVQLKKLETSTGDGTVQASIQLMKLDSDLRDQAAETYKAQFVLEEIDRITADYASRHRQRVISWLPPVRCGETGCTYCDSSNYLLWDNEEVASKQVEADADRHVDLLRERAKQLKTLCGPQKSGDIDDSYRLGTRNTG